MSSQTPPDPTPESMDAGTPANGADGTPFSLKRYWACLVGPMVIVPALLFMPWRAVGRGAIAALDWLVLDLLGFLFATPMNLLSLAPKMAFAILMVMLLSSVCFLIKTEKQKTPLDKPAGYMAIIGLAGLALMLMGILTNGHSSGLTFNTLLVPADPSNHNPRAQVIRALTPQDIRGVYKAALETRTWNTNRLALEPLLGDRADLFRDREDIRPLNRFARLVLEQDRTLALNAHCQDVVRNYLAAPKDVRARYRLSVQGKAVSSAEDVARCRWAGLNFLQVGLTGDPVRAGR